MRIRVSKVAMSNGKPRAFTIKIRGRKYPREHRGFYFTDSKEEAFAMALQDYKKDVVGWFYFEIPKTRDKL